MTDWWQNDPIVSPAPSSGSAQQWWANDPIKQAAPGQTPQEKPSALTPFTSLPRTYRDMVHSSVNAMGEGANRFMQGVHELDAGDRRGGLADIGLGAGGALSGAAGYVGAPISAAMHTIVGKPIADAATAVSGSPKAGKFVGDLAETAGTMLLPVPDKLPSFGGVKAASKEAAVVPTIEDLKEASAAGYQHPEVKSLALKPSAVQNWKDRLTVAMNEEGFDDVLAPKTFGVMKGLENSPYGGFVSGQNLNTLRKKLGRVAGSSDPVERAAASKAMESLDGFVSQIPPDAVLHGNPGKVSSIFADARGNWAAAKRSEQVDAALGRAALQAESAGSGMNLDNATRQRIKDILANPKRLRGFSKEEIAQMRRIVAGRPISNAARRAGNMLGGGGGLGATVAASAGAAKAGGVGALAPVVGYALKRVSAATTAADAAKLQELIRSRSPLAQQLNAPLRKWGEASTSFRSKPGPKTLARLMLASRNLSTNLKDAGLTVSPEQLVSSLQGDGGQQQPTVR